MTQHNSPTADPISPDQLAEYATERYGRRLPTKSETGQISAFVIRKWMREGVLVDGRVRKLPSRIVGHRRFTTVRHFDEFVREVFLAPPADETAAEPTNSPAQSG